VITRHDNGDGTTTFKGVDVVIPTSVADKYDVEAVRSASQGEKVVSGYLATTVDAGKTVTPFVVLTPRPTWKPPASLRQGVYRVDHVGLQRFDNGVALSQDYCPKLLHDWVTPSRLGLWQVNEDGTATYLGES
jgi:hypothetical protein